MDKKNISFGYILKITLCIIGVVLIVFGFTLSKLKNSEGNDSKTKLDYQQEMLNYIHDKYPGRTFKKGRSKDYCPLDNTYNYCNMYVYEISNISIEYSLSLNLTSGKIEFNSYAKNIVNNELAKEMVLAKLRENNVNVKSLNIEFYGETNKEQLNDSSLASFVENHSPKSWMIWLTLSNEGITFNNLLLQNLLTSIYSELSGVVSFNFVVENEINYVVKNVTGKISEDGIKIDYSNIEGIK